MDISIPSSKLDIEIDGEQHLTNSVQILRDIEKERNAFEAGYDTVHVTNHDAYKHTNTVASAIAEASEIRKEELGN